MEVFKRALKDHFQVHYFYSVEEFIVIENSQVLQMWLKTIVLLYNLM
jgi:hypothetical protein